MNQCLPLARFNLHFGQHRLKARKHGERRAVVSNTAVLQLIIWLLLYCFSMTAQSISFQEYITEVVNTNPLVREQVHAYRQVVQDHKIALSGWRPSLDVSGSVGRSSRKAPNTSQNRTTFNESQVDLTLTQNLFDGFNTTNQIAQARARISSAAYQLYDTADNVGLDAVKSYFTVLTEKRLVVLAARNVESHERIFSQIKERHAQGLGRLSDLEQTEGRLAQAHASLIAQQNNLQDALSEVHKLLGRYLSPREFLDPAEPAILKDKVEVLAVDAIHHHPAVQSAIFNIDAARYDYQRSRSSNLPSLNLQLQQSVGDNIGGSRGNLNEGSIMLQLKYNLYRGGADQAELLKKISIMQENDAFLGRVRRQVLDALRLAQTAYRALRDQLPFLERHVVKSQKTLELYGEEFLLQKRNLIDVLDAESELNRAKSREAEAHYLALTARYRVYEAQGRLFEPLKLKVEVTDNDLHIADIKANGDDALELPEDRDRDGLSNRQDQCDNTRKGSDVDAYGCQRQSRIKFGLAGVGLAPLATADVITAMRNQALRIPPSELLKNDSSPEGDALMISRYTQPASGSVERDADGNLIYVPDVDFVGEDKFDYTVSDSLGRTAVAQVVVWVKRADTARPDIPKVVIVQFGYKQLTLTDASQARIDAIIKTLSGRSQIRIEAYAYTDNIGSAKYNRRLSEWRAQAMKQMLINAGIEGQRITAIGKGEEDPIADNSSEDGRARNRRGEFRFMFAGD